MPRGAEKAWYENPWLWGGCGCCAGCLLIPILLAAVLGGGVFYAFKSSGIQQEALERVRAHPEAVAALGEPIESGWLIQGSINLSGDEGTADFSLPVSGPVGEGKLYVVAHRQAGEWTFEELLLRVEGRDEPIDLLAGEEPGEPGMLERGTPI